MLHRLFFLPRRVYTLWRYVAFVKDAEDVSLALKFAISNGIPIAVKCGGHNPSGSSSVEGGLVVDLSRHLGGVTVEAAEKIAYVGGGALWKAVDEATIVHGLAVPGGTNNQTGVGGLITGGGFGLLSAEHGLVIDNLIQATVVVASGEILTASESSNPDLFWAIRGGGGNFGIVTEFVLRLHTQRKTVFAGVVIFTPPQLKDVAETADKWWAAGPSNKGSLFVAFTRSPDHQVRPTRSF
jgi:FAD/FMN-containing dehydrogenase